MDFKDFDVACEVMREIVYKEMQARIADLEAQLAQYRWRRVEDEIPPDEVQVLVRVKWSADPTRTGFLDEGTWVVNGYGSGYVVTHWMPLPPAPQEE